jgi:hypothetical protein
VSRCAVYHSCTKAGGFHKFSTDWGGTWWYIWVCVCVTYTFHCPNPRRVASHLLVWHMPACAVTVLGLAATAGRTRVAGALSGAEIGQEIELLLT